LGKKNIAPLSAQRNLFFFGLLSGGFGRILRASSASSLFSSILTSCELWKTDRALTWIFLPCFGKRAFFPAFSRWCWGPSFFPSGDSFHHMLPLCSTLDARIGQAFLTVVQVSLQHKTTSLSLILSLSFFIMERRVDSISTTLL